MCAPQALIALQALQAAGQAFSTAEAAKKQEQQAKESARILQEQATEERRQGRLASNKAKVENAQYQSKQKNALAAAGITTDAGTAQDILKDSKALGEFTRQEKLKISNNRANALERSATNELDNLSYNSTKTKTDLFGQGSTLLTRNFNTFSKRGLLKF